MTRILDEVDRQIIALLQQDGRVSNVEIARAAGVAEGTVRKRLERLVGEGVIRIMAVAEPGTLGYGASVMIGIQTELGAMGEVARRLTQLPEVHSVNIVTGTYDVMIEVVLESADQLLAFLVDHISAIPGVRRTESSHVLQVVKRGCDWTVPTASVDQEMAPLGPSALDNKVIPGAIVVGP